MAVAMFIQENGTARLLLLITDFLGLSAVPTPTTEVASYAAAATTGAITATLCAACIKGGIDGATITGLQQQDRRL